jgi:translation initiation factor IF-3
VRVIGVDGQQLGIVTLADALNLARQQGVDLVEIAPNANPPVCRIVDFGKFRYEQAKRDKEAKKHQHANRVKEIQLSPSIDPHDLSVKLTHAIDFLCEEMKVKITLRFRGREMAHKEFGFQVVERFIKEVTPYGHPDSPPRLIGRGINVMLSPLPRNKRARNPRDDQSNGAPERVEPAPPQAEHEQSPANSNERTAAQRPATEHAGRQTANFGNNPFVQLDLDDVGK